MENRILLNKHKEKTILWHTFFKFIFIYTSIFIFIFTSIYFRNYYENKSLKSKFTRLSTIIEDKNILLNDFLTNMSDIEKDIFDDTFVSNKDWVIINSLSKWRFEYEIPLKKVIKIGNYKYYSGNIIKNNSEYKVITKYYSSDFLRETIVIVIILLSIWPFIFILLLWISKRSFNLVYKPLEDIVWWLESYAININHEFKTSLSEIISSLELAQHTKEYKTSNIQAINSSHRLNSILNSLSSMIHFVNSDYRKQKVNIIKELDESIKDYTKYIEDKNIIIVKKYEANWKIIKKIDKSPLLLCFLNILKNAIKYSDDWWKIEIFIQNDWFTIKDYWIWISKENLDKIFNRYFREVSWVEWSWIGLSIVKNITEIYKWKLDIKSEKNIYTEVIIKF